MPVQFHTYNSQFTVPAGAAHLTINYASDEYQTDTLDFDVVNIADLQSGYEDDDQLTFYPNVLTVTVDDFTRDNYDVLKYATQLRPPIFPINSSGTTTGLEQYYGVELKLNGITVFKGYVDSQNIQYDEQTGEMTFDALDYSSLLKTLSLEIRERGTDPFMWQSLPTALWWYFKVIYPNLPDPRSPSFGLITNNPDTFTQMDRGYYFKHNWTFLCGNPGQGFIRSWDMNSDPNGWAKARMYVGHIETSSASYSDYIRNLALETGCTIGSDAYNKVYIFKRFMNAAEMQGAEDISGKILSDGFSRFVHLPYIRGVRNINKRNPANITIEGDFPVFNQEANSKPLFENIQLDISTIHQRSISEDGENGPSTFKGRDDQNNEADVLNGIFDPSLDLGYNRIERIITRWTYLTRIRNRDRFEFRLDGINYRMHKIYLFWFSNIHYAYLRPMVIKRKLIEDITEMTALEINL